MTLIETQQKFSKLIGKFIYLAEVNGYDLTFGEAWRPPVTAQTYAQEGKGIVHSLHISRLAVDFNVFKDGILMQTKEEYKVVGELWKSLDPDCRWGGDFKRPDSDHFSIEWQGIQ